MPFHAPKRPAPAGDERLVELERVLFPPSAQEAHKGSIFHGPKLRASTEGAQVHESAPASSRLASQHASSGSKHRKRGGSHASPSRHIHAAHFGFNPLNPFESVVDATPAIRHLHPHSWRQLELALPPGCSPEVQQELKAELAQHLRSNTSLIGARVSSSPQGRPLASGTVPPLNLPPLGPNAQGALSSRVGSDAPFSPASTTQAFPSPRTGPQSAHTRSSLAAPQTNDGWLPPISSTEQVPTRVALPSEAMAAATAAGAADSSRSCRPPSRSASARKVEDLKSSLLPPLQQPVPPGRPKSSDAGLEEAAHGMRSAHVPSDSAEGRHSVSAGTPAGGVNGPRTPLPSIPAFSEGSAVGAAQGGGDGAQHAHVPCCATLQPAGIGSVGPWIERRGLELGSNVQTSHAPAALSLPTMPPTNASRADVSVTATVSTTRDGTPKGSPGVPPLTNGEGGGHSGSRVQQPGAACAGYGPGTTAAAAMVAGGALPAGSALGGPPVTLGALVSERQSVRRQAQLIAEWLEASVARLWQQHAQHVTQLGMRAALANRHSSGDDADVARPPQGPRATNSVFAGSFSKAAHVWHTPEPSASRNAPEQHLGHESQQPQGHGPHETQGGTVRSEAEHGDSMPHQPPMTERNMASEMDGSVQSGGAQPHKGRSPPEQGALQPEVLGLQRALSVLSGAGLQRKGSKVGESQLGLHVAFSAASKLETGAGMPAWRHAAA
ncbi:hypothetical protein DUNSADRAFT_16203 [Dunaliella salina]|uniref:Uncharacterized protein n=1 Tax=Dunaliella salina TaxID=3046 RepID=A0ABQ7G400_DUNSA|nr:hypothetical protein DUNSADRAFT_16203 [Dunaliella salina]|eukprot:KAF5829343.1 hypothetical protein DUNSADRAFT_16203 [Dunaliella salina]